MQRSLRDGSLTESERDQVFDLARLGIDQDDASSDNANADNTDSTPQEHHPLEHHEETDGDAPVPHWDDKTYDLVRLQHRLRKAKEPIDDATQDVATIDHRLRSNNKEPSNQAPRRAGSIDKVMDTATIEHRLKKDGNAASIDRAQFYNKKGSEEREEIYEDEEDNSQESNKNSGPSDAFAAGMMRERKKWRARKPAVSGPDAAAHLAEVPKHIPVITVVAMTIAMASAAGLGALPFFFVKKLSTHWSAVATAVACGVMFAASFDLIHEGQPYGAHLVILGVFLGGVFINLMQKWLDSRGDVHFGHLHGTRARRLVLMVGIMAAHAVGEGCGVGVSFCGERGWAQGVLTTIAIGVHNVPEGLAKATVLVSQGASAYEALFWSIVTCLPQPLVAVPSFIFVDTFAVLLPTALGFAAGCMIWMVFAELLPEALEGAKPSEIASAATLSAAALEGIRMALEGLEGPAGALLSPFQGGNWEGLLPAAAEVAPAVFTAVLAAGLISGSALPTPAVLAFSASALALCGIAPLTHQIMVNDDVPIGHTVSAAIGGIAAALLLRRYALQALNGASAARNATIENEKSYNTRSAGMKLSESGPDFAAYGTTDLLNNGSGYGTATRSGVTLRSHMDSHPLQPDSPSKTRDIHQLNGGSRPTGGKAPRLLAAPAQAAGLAVVAALLVQAVPLGWHFTREIADVDVGTLTLVPAMAVTLGIHGAAAGGAVRAVAGRSTGAGGLVGLFLGLVTAVVMLMSYFGAHEGTYSLIPSLSYPRGLTETLTAFGSGALCMSALFQVAVAMSMYPKHARFGLVLGVLCLGGLGGLFTIGCLTGNEKACTVLRTFLQ